MCKQCETKPVYEFTNQRKLCKNCFVGWFQKKVFYTIRKFQLIKKNEVVGYEKGDGFREIVLEDVLEVFAGKGNVELVKLRSQVRDIDKKLTNHKKVFKIAVSSTLDQEAGEIVHEIINGNIRKLSVKPIEDKIIKPLYLFLDKEVLLYAKLRNFRFKKISEAPLGVPLSTEYRGKDKISKFLDELEIKHPEVKRAVVKGWLKMYF